MNLSKSGESPHHELTLEIYQDGEKLTGSEAKAYRTKLTLALVKLIAFLSIGLVTLGAVLGGLATAAFGDDYGRSYVRAKYTIDTPKEAVEARFSDATAPQSSSTSASPESAEPASVPVALAWRPSFTHAATDAKRTGKPIWIHFSMSQGCGPCIAYERQVLSDAEFVAWANELTTPVLVDVLTEEGQKLAQRFGVKQVPRDVMLPPTQHKYRWNNSPQDPKQAAAWLREWAAKYTEQSVVIKRKSSKGFASQSRHRGCN